MFFTERSAAEFMSGDTEGGRPPGRRQLSRGRYEVCSTKIAALRQLRQ